MSIVRETSTQDPVLSELLGDVLYARPLSPQLFLYVAPLIFQRAKICIGDGLTVHDAWCYERPQQAIDEAARWDPQLEAEPRGWTRNPKTGRRRPGGDPAKEYINW